MVVGTSMDHVNRKDGRENDFRYDSERPFPMERALFSLFFLVSCFLVVSLHKN